MDAEGRTLDVNPAMCRLLDRPREALIGHEIYGVSSTGPASRWRAWSTRRC